MALRAWVRRAVRSPLAWILLATFVVRLVGITWGLPASDGWDNDGIAPRDFLPGLVLTFTPGEYFTYPPAHLLLLAILTLPITAVLLVRAPSFSPHDIVATAIHASYMTSYALVARVVSLAMSLGTVWAIAKMAESLRSRRAGLFAGGVAAVNVVGTYYAHTSNLDGPSLFWGSLSFLAVVRALEHPRQRGSENLLEGGELQRLRRAAVFAALAIGTKDQAYALFGLSLPIAIALWAVQKKDRAILREVAIATAVGVGLLLLIDGALVNPSGFRARLHFLTGPASQPHAEYSHDARGRLDALFDLATRWPDFYPLAFAPLGLLGVLRALSAKGRLVGALVPLLAIVSFTLLFNCVALRTEHRFVLPQMTLAAVFVGLGLDVLYEALSGAPPLALFAASSLLAWGLARAIEVDAALLMDPRYDAETWLKEHAVPGDTVEVHGKNVYLPRFPPWLRVTRVGTDPASARNPLEGVSEREDAYGDIEGRRPRFIVVSGVTAGQYLFDPHAAVTGGRVAPTALLTTSSDSDASSFFHALFDQRLAYALAHESTWTSQVWSRVDVHASTTRDVWIFERRKVP